MIFFIHSAVAFHSYYWIIISLDIFFLGASCDGEQKVWNWFSMEKKNRELSYVRCPTLIFSWNYYFSIKWRTYESIHFQHEIKNHRKFKFVFQPRRHHRTTNEITREREEYKNIIFMEIYINYMHTTWMKKERRVHISSQLIFIWTENVCINFPFNKLLMKWD